MKEYKRLTKRDKNGFVEFEECEECDYCGSAGCDSFENSINRLAELEDKIENGTLVELPCKVGTTIYHLYKAGNVITEDKVYNYHFEICTKPCVSFENYFWYGTNKRVDTILVNHFGKYWFTGKAEAEKKLEALKNENTCKQ